MYNYDTDHRAIPHERYTRSYYSYILLQMIARLKCNHFSIYTPTEREGERDLHRGREKRAKKGNHKHRNVIILNQMWFRTHDAVK